MTYRHHFLIGLAATATLIATGATLVTTPAQAAGKKVADISQYQGNINWSKASKDLKMAIIRVQHGDTGDSDFMIDSKKDVNANAAYKYNVPFGQYAFSEFSSVADAKKEAKDFYARSNKHARFFVLDDEKRGAGATGKEQTYVNAWLSTMRGLTNKPLVFYSGEWYTTSHKISTAKFDGAWIAKYSSTRPSIKTDLWQYTSTGRVSGISGNVDLNKILNSATVAKWIGSTTSNSHATPTYYTSVTSRQTVTVKKGIYEYTNTLFAKGARVKKLKAGTRLTVTAVTKNSKNAYRFQLTNGHYITASKDYVSL